jgi:uncharacterized membrane protein
MLYTIFKVIHLVGVVVLIGNVTVTAFWKIFADRTADMHIIAHAQRLVSLTDWVFTFAGILLIYIGGFGAALVGGLNPFGPAWLLWGHGLFALSGSIWLGILVPIQIRQARHATNFIAGGVIPPAYLRDSRRWLIWGIIATLPLVAAICIMVAKP